MPPQVSRAEAAGQAQGELTRVLDRRGVDMAVGVGGGVITRCPVEEGEVDPGNPGAVKLAEVGVVGQVLVYLVPQREADRRTRPGELGQHVRVGIGGLERHERSVGAAGIEVDHHRRAGIDAEGVEHLPSAEQTVLLTVGEKEHRVVAWPLAMLQRPRHLQQCGNAHRVVVGTRSGPDAVVVRHQVDSPGRRRAGQAGHHRVEPSDRDRHAQTWVGHSPRQHPGLPTQPTQLEQEILPGLAVGDRAGRSGARGQGLHMRQRTRGGELARPGLHAGGVGWTQGEQVHQDGEHDDHQPYHGAQCGSGAMTAVGPRVLGNHRASQGNRGAMPGVDRRSLRGSHRYDYLRRHAILIEVCDSVICQWKRWSSDSSGGPGLRRASEPSSSSTRRWRGRATRARPGPAPPTSIEQPGKSPRYWLNAGRRAAGVVALPTWSGLRGGVSWLPLRRRGSGARVSAGPGAVRAGVCRGCARWSRTVVPGWR